MHETGEPHVHEEEINEKQHFESEHTHDHEHDHEHHHDHHHDHEHHDHDHHHDHEHHDHTHVHQHEVTPKALLTHMSEHNRNHLEELRQVAGMLEGEALVQLNKAIEALSNGNDELAKVLELI